MTRGAVRAPGVAAVALLASALLGGCAGQPRRTTTVAPTALATPSGTLAVAVSSDGPKCRGARDRCAITAAMETVLFRGVPGSVQPLPLVADERAARDAHGPFIAALTSGDLGRQYVVRSERGADDRSFVITFNVDRLRDALVREGVVRRFGY